MLLFKITRSHIFDIWCSERGANAEKARKVKDVVKSYIAKKKFRMLAKMQSYKKESRKHIFSLACPNRVDFIKLPNI